MGWMPPVLQGDFLTFLGLALLSVVCQASYGGLMVPRAGMHFEGRRPHRFSEVGASKSPFAKAASA